VNIAKAEVGILTILDLGNPALAAAELGGHLRLGQSSSHPSDDELVDELGLDGKLSDRLSNASVAMSTEHIIDATIGTRTCGWAAGDGLK